MQRATPSCIIVGHNPPNWKEAPCVRTLKRSSPLNHATTGSISTILWSSVGLLDVPDAPDWVREASSWSQFVAPVMGNPEQVGSPWYIDTNSIKTAVSSKFTHQWVFLTVLMGSGRPPGGPSLWPWSQEIQNRLNLLDTLTITPSRLPSPSKSPLLGSSWHSWRSWWGQWGLQVVPACSPGLEESRTGLFSRSPWQ